MMTRLLLQILSKSGAECLRLRKENANLRERIAGLEDDKIDAIRRYNDSMAEYAKLRKECLLPPVPAEGGR